MKRLNLDDTWKYCMRMWRWIADRIKAGDEQNVNTLKRIWLENNQQFDVILDNCFFCNHSVGGCSYCPGKKVDKSFDCTDEDYAFDDEPIKFYKRLKKLNRLRKLGRKLQVKE